MNESETDQPGAWRLVLDTNVVMALWHFRDPGLPRLRSLCEQEGSGLFCREDSLDELQRVLAYRQFGIAPADQAAIHAGYVSLCRTLQMPDEPRQAQLALLPRCGDRDDQKFLEIAWEASANFLLSRDKLLLKLARRQPFRDTLRIMTPERFEQLLHDTPVGSPQECAAGAVKKA